MAFGAMLVAACGGTPGGAGSASAPATRSAGPAATGGPAASRSADVCDLIDRPAAEAFFGARTGIHFQSKTACRLLAGAVDLSVSVASPRSRSEYDTARAARTDAVDVPGIGEVADYSSKLSALHFLEGDTITAIQVVGGAFDAAKVRAFIEAQARFAASAR
jgi:hypothetical protein